MSITAAATASYSTNLAPDTYEVIVIPAGNTALTQMNQRFTGIAISAAGLSQDFILTRGIAVTGTIFDDLGVRLQANGTGVLPG